MSARPISPERLAACRDAIGNPIHVCNDPFVDAEVARDLLAEVDRLVSEVQRLQNKVGRAEWDAGQLRSSLSECMRDRLELEQLLEEARKELSNATHLLMTVGSGLAADERLR